MKIVAMEQVMGLLIEDSLYTYSTPNEILPVPPEAGTASYRYRIASVPPTFDLHSGHPWSFE